MRFRPEPDAAFLLIDDTIAEEVESRMKESYFREIVLIRGNAEETSVLYLSEKVFRDLFSRTRSGVRSRQITDSSVTGFTRDPAEGLGGSRYGGGGARGTMRAVAALLYAASSTVLTALVLAFAAGGLNTTSAGISLAAGLCVFAGTLWACTRKESIAATGHRLGLVSGDCLHPVFSSCLSVARISRWR
jgi:hypothetical protein